MPQLKKIPVTRSNILPRLEFPGENIYSTYEIGHQDLTTYVPIFSDTKLSNSLSSEAESDGASSIPNKPRKRQRLDHLSQEEKIMRRKMKNRVAAQTARDRKKARMAELEEQVLELETERKMLMLSNMNLQAQNEVLQKENEELKRRLSGVDVNAVQVKKENTVEHSDEVAEVKSRLSDSSRSIEHAEGTGSATSYTLDDALRLLTDDCETDALLDILQQYTDDLLQPEDLSSSLSELPDVGTIEESESSTPEVVGTSTKSLESHKELIHFDHIYYKQEDDISNPDQSVLSSSELSTKDCSMDISSSLDTGCVIEVDSSEIPVICISESNSETEKIPVICISESNPESETSTDVLNFKKFSYDKLESDLLSPVDIKPIPSPVSSDGGYDSSFSVSSPSTNVNPWDDTFTELFPSLV